MPAISGSRTRSIIGRAWQPSTTRSAAAAMPRCASAATATAAPCAPSPTACCRWPPHPPPGRAPRAAAVKDAAANAAASAEPAQSVLDRASTVLPFALEALHHKGVVRGYRPAFFRLILGGRYLPSAGESISGGNSKFIGE